MKAPRSRPTDMPHALPAPIALPLSATPLGARADGCPGRVWADPVGPDPYSPGATVASATAVVIDEVTHGRIDPVHDRIRLGSHHPVDTTVVLWALVHAHRNHYRQRWSADADGDAPGPDEIAWMAMARWALERGSPVEHISIDRLEHDDVVAQMARAGFLDHLDIASETPFSQAWWSGLVAHPERDRFSSPRLRAVLEAWPVNAAIEHRLMGAIREHAEQALPFLAQSFLRTVASLSFGDAEHHNKSERLARLLAAALQAAPRWRMPPGLEDRFVRTSNEPARRSAFGRAASGPVEPSAALVHGMRQLTQRLPGRQAAGALAHLVAGGISAAHPVAEAVLDELAQRVWNPKIMVPTGFRGSIKVHLEEWISTTLQSNTVHHRMKSVVRRIGERLALEQVGVAVRREGLRTKQPVAPAPKRRM